MAGKLSTARRRISKMSKITCGCACHRPDVYRLHKEGHGCCENAQVLENTPTSPPTTDIDRILDDAYALGKTDALLPSANDYPVIMPKMKAKAHALIKAATDEAYETGYKDGESSGYADYQGALRELTDIEPTVANLPKILDEAVQANSLVFARYITEHIEDGNLEQVLLDCLNLINTNKERHEQQTNPD